MPISNINPSPREVVLLQRDDTNTFYNEVHISASNAIIYLDNLGYLNVDSPQTLFGLYPVTYSISSSWASSSLSTSYVYGGNVYGIVSASNYASYSLSSSWASSSISSSWASSSLNSGYSSTSSYALTASSISGITGSNLLYLQCSDGNTYQVTLNNYNGLISVNVGQIPVTGINNFLNIGTVNTLTTGSTYPITSSWAITASYAMNGGSSGSSVSSSYSLTSSYASTASFFSAISGSNLLYLQCNNGNTYPVTLTADGGTIVLTVGQTPVTGTNNFLNIGTVNTLITGSTYPITSSWAITASYAMNGGSSGSSVSSSYASTSSYALTASSISGITGSNLLYLQSTDGYTYPVTLTTYSGSILLTVGQTPVTGTNNFLNIGTINTFNLTTGSTYPITSSWAITASYAMNGGSSGSSVSSSYASTSSIVPFNGNRSITRTGYTGLDVGGSDVDTFLNNFFFPFISATVSDSGGGTFQTGTLQTINVLSTITVNSETSFGSASVFRDSLLWNTEPSIPPYSFTFTDTNVSSSQTYQTFVQVGNNGSPTNISSNTTTVSFIFPYLWGLSTTSSLSGSALYNAFPSHVVNEGDQTIDFNGTAVYIYFAYPSTYPNLSSILDPNSFQVIGSFNETIASVTSTGLTNNWTTNYKIYQTQLVSSPDGNFQFIY